MLIIIRYHRRWLLNLFNITCSKQWVSRFTYVSWFMIVMYQETQLSRYLLIFQNVSTLTLIITITIALTRHEHRRCIRSWFYSLQSDVIMQWLIQYCAYNEYTVTSLALLKRTPQLLLYDTYCNMLTMSHKRSHYKSMRIPCLSISTSYNIQIISITNSVSSSCLRWEARGTSLPLSVDKSRPLPDIHCVTEFCQRALYTKQGQLQGLRLRRLI